MTRLLIAAAAAVAFRTCAAFSPASSHLQPGHRGPRTARRLNRSPLQMCICIHCKHVTNCSAYYFVEEQHSQPHINKNPTWEPRNGSPTINVHIRPDEDKTVEDELGKMWEEHEDQTRQAEESSSEMSDGAGADAPLFGEKQYDLSGTTSYEYDVVECEDFVQDTDAWVRNMPEEIRIANPDFVPT